MFDPSTLAITTIDVGNPASNVIPAEARATLNIRFNDLHDSAGLSAWIEQEADRVAAEFGIGIAARFQVSGESFLTEPGPFSDLVAAAVEAETGLAAGPLDQRRHLGRALRQGALPGGRGRAGGRDDAPGRRACVGRARASAQGDLFEDHGRLLRRRRALNPDGGAAAAAASCRKPVLIAHPFDILYLMIGDRVARCRTR